MAYQGQPGNPSFEVPSAQGQPLPVARPVPPPPAPPMDPRRLAMMRLMGGGA